MTDHKYERGKKVHGPRARSFRTYVKLILLLVILIAAVAVAAYIDNNRNQNQPSPVSKLRTYTISGSANTFTGPYFKFKDNGKWVFDKKDSTANKFVYFKYLGLEVQHQLIIYVNQVPIPSELGATRVLPVRIVNDNTFDVTNVTNNCVSYYKAKEVHKQKTLSIEGASMLCNPGTAEYSVILSQIGGDYRLNLKRPGGQKTQYIIIYRDLTLSPGPGTVKNIAKTFQAI